MAKNNLNFHQTFPPTADGLSRLTLDCPVGETLTKEQISEKTGIPTGKSSGKVEPYLAYAEYMGLLTDTRQNGKHLITRTELGSTIYRQDPGFQENVTLFVCHFRLTSAFGGAPLWSAIVRNILPRYPSGADEATLRVELERIFGIAPKLGPFYSSYAGMFQPLGVLERGGGVTKLHAHSFRQELLYAYAYGLLYDWECQYPGQSEITARDIASLSSFAALGWNAAQAYDALERLAEARILRFNRQLTPYIVTKLLDADTTVSRLYDALC